MDQIKVPISPGELIDKLTILEIKLAKITAPDALANVRREHRLLDACRKSITAHREEITALSQALFEVNHTLWVIEDDIRRCEAVGDFGPGFIELARAVYTTNDRRAALKRQINLLLDSDLIEEKSYEETGRSG